MREPKIETRLALKIPKDPIRTFSLTVFMDLKFKNNIWF